MRRIWLGLGLGLLVGGCFSSPGGPPLLVYGDAGRADLSSGSLTDGGMTGSSSAAAHNLATLNMYRAQAGSPALVLDDQLSQFATAGSGDLAQGGQAHAYFSRAASDGSIWTSGFCNGAAENQ